MTDPDFNLLIALDALLTEASVAGAAQRLNLSTSAMSRTLSRLRDVTGDPLLVRAGRNMVLTPYAEASRDRARNAVLEARAVLQPSASELNIAQLERVFTLRVNDGFIEAFGPPLIAAVAAMAPGVCLRFSPKPEKSSRFLREGLVDLEIGVLSNMGPEIRVQALYRDRFVGVVRHGHPLAGKAQVSVEEYIAWGHVIASRRGQPSGPVDEALAELGLARKVVSVVPGFPSALAVAKASDLIALVPASFLFQTDNQSRLKAFELPFKTRTITISQLWHPRMEADPAHRWLRHTVLAVCQKPCSEQRDLCEVQQRNQCT